MSLGTGTHTFVGDLDGDIFNIITLPDLHPISPPDPAAYKSAGRKELDRECQIADIADFIIEYIISVRNW